MTTRDTAYVRGAERLARRIQTIRRSLALPVLTNEIGELLLRRTLDRFDREVDPDGDRWVPLKSGTQRVKARLGVGGILKRTLRLRNSIRLIRGSVTGLIFTNTGAGIRIGVADPTAAVYGGYHNRGVRPNPQRRFLGIGELDVKSVDSFLRRRALTAVEES